LLATTKSWSVLTVYSLRENALAKAAQAGSP
jgi:hypothetical protein